MFGVGLGMLYTPILVDRMKLAYPSGYAVANILRALTDKNLLKRSIVKLGGSTLIGYVVGIMSLRVATVEALGISSSTFGAGMIVGARLAIPALVVALTGLALTPYLVSIGWLAPGDPYRKIGFLFSLGTILGAAIFDITLILLEAVGRFRQQNAEPAKTSEDWKRLNTLRLILWIIFWGAGIVLIGNRVLHQPVFFLLAALALSFVFVLVNGISLGISDWSPISSAFVVTVFVLAGLGLRDPGIGLLCASIVLIACSEGSDMQQDRSTGWRLGTNRVVQFRYQVIGIAMGAVLAVVLAKVFMGAYPILNQDQFSNPNLPGAEKWQSAMTFKLVGALRGITKTQPHVMKALQIGIALGLFIEITRKWIKARPAYKKFSKSSRSGAVIDFLIDAVLLPSPYASSFGGFIKLQAVYWWAAGGIGASLFEGFQTRLAARQSRTTDHDLPPDMSTTALVGGGLIAGDSLAALSVGIFLLIKTVL
jgi:hypothetical protein